MKIQRISTYTDLRFDSEILKQHGAFLVDDIYPCQFKIINNNRAIMDWHDYNNVDELIEEFRFYSEHITEFYSKEGKLLKKHPQIELFDLEIEQIQPSQFYIDSDKLNAISSFIHSAEEIVIPVVKLQNTDHYISADGHTRLYFAHQKKYPTIKAHLTENSDYLLDFVKEAQKRNIFHVKDMTLVPHAEYKYKWDKFCDDFFAKKM